MSAETQVVSDGAVVVEKGKDPLVVFLNAIGADLLQHVTGEGHGMGGEGSKGEVDGMRCIAGVEEVGNGVDGSA